MGAAGVIVTGRRVLLALVILVIEFAGLEAALRLHGGSEAGAEFQSLFMQDPRVGFRLKPGAHARYTTAEFSTDLTINAQGVRDDRDIGPKRPNERRVLVLGDSLTFAVQVPLAQTFCKRLEALLAAADPAREWRVIDGGVQGYGPVEEWFFYQHVADALEPDIVLVVSFVANDAVEAFDAERSLDAGVPAVNETTDVAVNRLRKLTRASMVLQIARLRVDQLRESLRGPATERPLTTYSADPPPAFLHGLDVTRRALGLVAARAAERGARTGIVLMPARFQTDDADYGRLADIVRASGGELLRHAATERFQTALAPLGLPMWDLLPVLAAEPDRGGLFFQQNVHLTPRGHDVVARSLLRFIQMNGWVPPAESPAPKGQSHMANRP